MVSLDRFPELKSFFSTYLMDADQDADEGATRAFMEGASAALRDQVLSQAKLLLEEPELPVSEFGAEANRWFEGQEDARAWLDGIAALLDRAPAEAAVVVKDSNGTVLAEGDSVQVIKDLKVKGGSSDLKRGTLVKKIHLVDDPEAVECRVDGTALVLKTCFLKKV